MSDVPAVGDRSMKAQMRIPSGVRGHGKKGPARELRIIPGTVAPAKPQHMLFNSKAHGSSMEHLDW